MKEELMVFQSPEFGEFRTAEREGETWFCLADVCRPLGLLASDVRKRLKSEGMDTIQTLTNRGTQKMLFVNEGNLYRAIFQSKKPEAERFTDWVTEEVLPSIRKTGRYESRPMTAAEQLAAQANLLVELERRTAAMEERMDRALTALAGPRERNWTEDMKEAIANYCKATGLTEVAGRGRLYAELDRTANCNTDARLSRLRDRKKRAGVRRRDYMALTKLDAIALDGRLRAAFEGVVSRMTAQAELK